MEAKSDNLRERLLAEHQPDPGKLAEYRKEIENMLEGYEKRLRFEKWIVGPMWIYIVLLATAYFTLSGWFKGDAVVTVGWFSGAATFLMITIALAAQLVGVRVGMHQLETLKELKKIEMEVLELRQAVGKTES